MKRCDQCHRLSLAFHKKDCPFCSTGSPAPTTDPAPDTDTDADFDAWVQELSHCVKVEMSNEETRALYSVCDCDITEEELVAWLRLRRNLRVVPER